jgi:RNA:NAD 2'-phosphotransferase (TPT1/KptA family)
MKDKKIDRSTKVLYHGTTPDAASKIQSIDLHVALKPMKRKHETEKTQVQTFQE